jgi:hypothetical protein
MTTEPSELVVVREQAPALAGFATASPALTLQRGKAVADAAAPVIRDLGMVKRIHQSFHVYFDGWTMVGAMVGVFPVTVRTWEIGHDEGYGANVEARSLSGEVVGAADAIVMRDEEVGGKQKWLEAPAFQVVSMAQCVPVETEILTRRGWLRQDQLLLGEDVLAYDLAADFCRWVPLEDVSVYADQPLMRMRSRSLDVLCTPEHTWPIRASRGEARVEYRKLVQAQAFPGLGMHPFHALVVAAPAEGGFSPLTPEEAAVIGWLVTDGTLRWSPTGNPRIHIDQSKPHGIAELQRLLAGKATERIMPAGERTFPTGRTYATRQAHRFDLSAVFARYLLERAGMKTKDDLPLLVPHLSVKAREAMLAAVLQAEAHVRLGGGRTGRTAVLGQREGRVLDGLQLLVALSGRALGKPQFGPEQGFVRQTIRSNRYLQTSHIRQEPAGRGDVWCPTTALGTWVMRQRGQVIITGNTRAGGKALRQPLGWIMRLAGYEATPAEEMDEAAAARGETVTGGRGVAPGWRDIGEQNNTHQRMNVHLANNGLGEWAATWLDSKGYHRPLSKPQMADLRRAVDRELEDRKTSGPGASPAPQGATPGPDPTSEAGERGTVARTSATALADRRDDPASDTQSPAPNPPAAAGAGAPTSRRSPASPGDRRDHQSAPSQRLGEGDEGADHQSRPDSSADTGETTGGGGEAGSGRDHNPRRRR